MRRSRSGQSWTGNRARITPSRSTLPGGVGRVRDPPDPGELVAAAPGQHVGRGELERRDAREPAAELGVGRLELGGVELVERDVVGHLGADDRAGGGADDDVGVGEVDTRLAPGR